MLRITKKPYQPDPNDPSLPLNQFVIECRGESKQSGRAEAVKEFASWKKRKKSLIQFLTQQGNTYEASLLRHHMHFSSEQSHPLWVIVKQPAYDAFMTALRLADQPAYCRVRGRLKGYSRSQTGWEVWDRDTRSMRRIQY